MKWRRKTHHVAIFERDGTVYVFQVLHLSDGWAALLASMPMTHRTLDDALDHHAHANICEKMPSLEAAQRACEKYARKKLKQLKRCKCGPIDADFDPPKAPRPPTLARRGRHWAEAHRKSA